MHKQAYYKDWFTIKPVKIIAVERHIKSFLATPEWEYKYLILFESGKLKHVKSKKLIFIQE